MTKMLIVSGDESIRQEVVQAADGLGYSWFAVSTGTTASQVILDNPELDLVIVDRELKDVDGRGLVRRQETAAWPKIPAIIISDRVPMRDISHFAGLGACYFFAKPVAAAEFMRYMERVINNDVTPETIGSE